MPYRVENYIFTKSYQSAACSILYSFSFFHMVMQSAVLAMIDSVCLSVCHSPVSCQNNSSYDHAVFTGG